MKLDRYIFLSKLLKIDDNIYYQRISNDAYYSISLIRNKILLFHKK
jgi:hypothetical protein